MRNLKSNLKVNFGQIVLIATSFAVFTACGSTTARQSTTGGSSSTTIPTGTPFPGGNYTDLEEAPTYTAEINGANGTVKEVIYQIETSRTLKVRVTPLAAPNLTLPGYTNWQFPYGCVRLRITVNGVTRTTDILRVDGISQGATSVCKNSATYQVIDFRNSITGNGTAQVKVSNAEYDNCRYTWPLNYGCQMSAIFQNHVVASTVQIQGDNTWMDP